MNLNQVPKISVIIPVYNTAEFLPRCLNSVLNNTYTNFEVLCINDGSSDNSAEILAGYQRQDSRVVVITQKNAGVSVARNTGMDLASGDFIAFIDSDDWVHPRYFEFLINAQRKYNADCVVCGVEITEVEKEYPNYDSNAFSFYATDIHSVMADKFGRTNIWGRIYTKSLIKDIKFPCGIKIAEDTVFNLNVLCQRDDIVAVGISPKLYFYFQRVGSAVHTLPNSLVHQAIPYYVELYQKAAGHNGIYIIEQILKTTLAYRYLSMFRPDYHQVKEECHTLLRMCIKHLKHFPIKKRIIFFLFSKSPAIYRMYRIIDDKSLLMWEENEKQRYRSHSI